MISKKRRVSGDATDRKARALKFQVVRVADGHVFAGNDNKHAAMKTCANMGEGFEVRERRAKR